MNKKKLNKNMKNDLLYNWLTQIFGTVANFIQNSQFTAKLTYYNVYNHKTY